MAIKTTCYIFIIVVILISFNDKLYSKDLVIEMSAVLDSHNEFDRNIDSIIREYIYEGKKVYVISLSERVAAKETTIKNRYNISNFYYSIGKSQKLLNKRNVIFAQSEELISYLKSRNIKYSRVVNDKSYNKSSNNKYLLKLEDKNNAKILLTDKMKNLIDIKLNKNSVIVLDGDTILYNNIKYRFLGIDAPEMAQEPYGEIAKNFVFEAIKNADVVSIKIAEFDIYGRVLAHIMVDGKPLSLLLMQNKLALQTVTTYGDNGFAEITTQILEYAKKQGRLPFKSPSAFRREQAKEND